MAHNSPLTPTNGNVLVQLGTKYKRIVAAAKAYETKTNGVALEFARDIQEPEFELGRRVYWQDYKEGAPILIDGVEYAFVKYEDIQGYYNG